MGALISVQDGRVVTPLKSSEKCHISQVTEQMMRFTSMRGPPAVVLDTLARLGSGFSGIDGFSTSLADLQRVVSLLDSLGCLSRFELDLSIVGGFDYYTGIVFEVFRGASPDDDAIAAGGRCDCPSAPHT